MSRSLPLTATRCCLCRAVVSLLPRPMELEGRVCCQPCWADATSPKTSRVWIAEFDGRRWTAATRAEALDKFIAYLFAPGTRQPKECRLALYPAGDEPK